MRLQKNSKEETANKKHKLITVNSKSFGRKWDYITGFSKVLYGVSSISNVFDSE
jgi:hypothetical protein